MIALLGALACAPAPLALEATADPTGVSVRASRPVDRLELRDAAGTPLVRRVLPAPTAEVLLPAALAPGERVRVVAGARGQAATLDLAVGQASAAPAAAAPAAGAVRVTGGAFPTDAFGVAEPARSADRMELPGVWAAWAGSGVGWRARADQAPWAWTRVDLASDADTPADLAVTLRVLDPADRVPPALRAWVRDAPSDGVSAVVRVPARGTASVALPVFADTRRVVPGRYTREIAISPLGGGEILAVDRRPLVVRRSGRALAAGIALAAVGVLGGWALLVARGRAWLAALSPAEALVVGLLGTLGHLAGAVVQLAGAGLGAVLGPFAPFATGLVDDVLRVCLLGALLALVPRPGVAALAAVVGTAVRAIVLGSFHPLDLLAVGATVAWLEAAVAVGGATAPGWTRRPRAWWRLGAAIVAANVALTATSLVFGAVGWRLFYSAPYVLALLALPGAAYAAVGCALAVRFSASLERVAP